MALTCRYFADGSYYGQEDFAKMMRDSVGNGYVYNVGDKLIVSPVTGMTVSVGTGRGYVNGYSFDVTDSAYNLTVTASESLPRIDRVVARLSAQTDRNITLAVLKGTAAASPVAPALTQTNDVYEIPLAQIAVGANVTSITSSDITDERVEIGNPASTLDCIEEITVNGTTVPKSRHTAAITIPTYPDASTTEKGIVQIGSNLSVSSGTISVPVATTSTAGVMKVGSNLSVSSGTVSVPYATTSTAGVIKAGDGLSISSGVLSVSKSAVFTATVGSGRTYSTIGSALSAGIASGASAISLIIYAGTYAENISIPFSDSSDGHCRTIELHALGSYTINGSINIQAPVTFMLTNNSATVTLNYTGSEYMGGLRVGHGANLIASSNLVIDGNSQCGITTDTTSVIRASVITFNNCSTGILSYCSLFTVVAVNGSNTSRLVASVYGLSIISETPSGYCEKGTNGTLIVAGAVRT